MRRAIACNWSTFEKTSEAVGELYVQWYESEQINCPSKFHF